MSRRTGSSGAVAAVFALLMFLVVGLFKIEARLVATAWRGVRDRASTTAAQKAKAAVAGCAALLVPVLIVVGLVSSGTATTTTAAASDAHPTSSPEVPAPTATVVASVPTVRTTSATSGLSTRRAVSKSPRGELVLAGGVVLPNRALTPGAVNPAVTQSTITRTICRTGYTKTIRPSSSYTTSLKRQQLAAGYTFRGDINTSDYEEDHLISLELGGSPTSVKNLWPEPYAAAEGARVKDRIENELHDDVCSGRLTLRAAQQVIAGNWWTAYQRYGGEGAPQVWDGSYTAAAPASTTRSSATSSSAAPSGATARCNDGTYSYSQHRRGTCSRHGGVAEWINPPPS